MTTRPFDASQDFRMNELVAMLKERGIEAQIWHTGGGCATLYVGELLADDDDNGSRYVACVGPGYFDADPVGHWDELWIGADDDETGIYWQGPRDLAKVADHIVANMDDYRAAVLAWIAEVVNA